MCQPADPRIAATKTELNRAEVLELLRTNKNAERFVPDWIDGKDSDNHSKETIEKDDRNEKLERLSSILRSWMESHVPQAATSAILDIAGSRKGMKKQNPKNSDGMCLEDKFKLENFDLITWEYISK